MPWVRRRRSRRFRAGAYFVPAALTLILVWLIFANFQHEAPTNKEPSWIGVFNPPWPNPTAGRGANFKTVDDFLKVFPASVRSAVASVEVTDHCSHYSSRAELAHCHSSRRVCVTTWAMKYKPETIWHEVGHAYHYRLNELRDDFEVKANAVRGGALTDYSRTAVYEKVAEYTQHFYMSLHYRKSEFDKLTRGDFSQSSPYRQMLELMREKEFFSESDYQQFRAKYNF